MPPHLARIAPPRLLCHVLRDLKEAKRDVDQAQEELRHATLGMHALHYDDLQDRAAEAETRFEDLRDEFAARFREATGLTWREVERAVSEAVL